MNRRQFLLGSGTTVTCAAVFGQRAERAKLDRIAIMSLCFSPVIKSAARPDDPKRTLDIMDLPEMIAERYGVHHVEMQHSHFASTEPAYFEEFRQRMNRAKSQMNQINVEFGPLNISATEPVTRLETIDLTKKWVDHAVMLGCPRVMVNQGTLAPDVRQAAIDTLKAINAYARSKKVFITMENRGFGGGGAGRGGAALTNATLPPSWEVVVEVIKASGIHANPDVGNFPNEEARAAGLRDMYPLSSGSSHCHYDPQRYSEAAAIQISKEVGYKGLYSIEASVNNGPDPYVAVQTILDEIVKAL